MFVYCAAADLHSLVNIVLICFLAPNDSMFVYCAAADLHSLVNNNTMTQ